MEEADQVAFHLAAPVSAAAVSLAILQLVKESAAVPQQAVNVTALP